MCTTYYNELHNAYLYEFYSSSAATSSGGAERVLTHSFILSVAVLAEVCCGRLVSSSESTRSLGRTVGLLFTPMFTLSASLSSRGYNFAISLLVIPVVVRMVAARTRSSPPMIRSSITAILQVVRGVSS